MSLEGYLMYGDRGPIIGRWPQPKIRPAGLLQAGARVVIDNGLIRKARNLEWGAKLPEGAYIEGDNLNVPAWWWWLHFGERLIEAESRECCGDGGVSRDHCHDCPKISQAATQPEEQIELWAPVVNSVVPCWRGSGVAGCSWPACKPDCDGRPGRAR